MGAFVFWFFLVRLTDPASLLGPSLAASPPRDKRRRNQKGTTSRLFNKHFTCCPGVATSGQLETRSAYWRSHMQKDLFVEKEKNEN
eukprot:scaffold2603_cov225-Pinguiococcus_pyrenoidosus.AAC.2